MKKKGCGTECRALWLYLTCWLLIGGKIEEAGLLEVPRR